MASLAPFLLYLGAVAGAVLCIRRWHHALYFQLGCLSRPLALTLAYTIVLGAALYGSYIGMRTEIYLVLTVMAVVHGCGLRRARSRLRELSWLVETTSASGDSDERALAETARPYLERAEVLLKQDGWGRASREATRGTDIFYRWFDRQFRR